jgi:hypothetical protein
MQLNVGWALVVFHLGKSTPRICSTNIQSRETSSIAVRSQSANKHHNYGLFFVLSCNHIFRWVSKIISCLQNEDLEYAGPPRTLADLERYSPRLHLATVRLLGVFPGHEAGPSAIYKDNIMVYVVLGA